jgi:hypothetical protein
LGLWLVDRTIAARLAAALNLAVEQETTLNALAVEAFNDLVKKHGKRQSAENPLLD